MNSSKKTFLPGAPVVLLAFFRVCAVLWLCVNTVPSWGQNAASGAISGQVTDPQAGPVPGALVRLTEVLPTNRAGTLFQASRPASMT
jgi:hypothetical protein